MKIKFVTTSIYDPKKQGAIKNCDEYIQNTKRKLKRKAKKFNLKP